MSARENNQHPKTEIQRKKPKQLNHEIIEMPQRTRLVHTAGHHETRRCTSCRLYRQPCRSSGNHCAKFLHICFCLCRASSRSHDVACSETHQSSTNRRCTRLGPLHRTRNHCARCLETLFRCQNKKCRARRACHPWRSRRRKGIREEDGRGESEKKCCKKLKAQNCERAKLRFRLMKSGRAGGALSSVFLHMDSNIQNTHCLCCLRKTYLHCHHIHCCHHNNYHRCWCPTDRERCYRSWDRPIYPERLSCSSSTF